MYALEEEPEKKGRGKRLLVGIGLVGGIAVTMLTVAQHVKPSIRLLPEILEMAVVVDEGPLPPPKVDIPPPPPPPPPPPRKQKAEKEEEPEPAPPEEQAKQEEAPAEEATPEVGMDSSSFATGGSGVGMGFRAGKTQMGDPTTGLAAKKAVVPVVPLNPPKLVPAMALEPELPEYPDSARKSNIEGYVLLELDIDDRGKLKKARVRQGLQRALDDAALAAVQAWRFQPARLDGRAVSSTRLVRIRFELN
jgi:protein TonB